MEHKIFIKTSENIIICVNDIIKIGAPVVMRTGNTRREITLNNKSYVWISEEDYAELENIMKSNMKFFCLSDMAKTRNILNSNISNIQVNQ